MRLQALFLTGSQYPRKCDYSLLFPSPSPGTAANSPCENGNLLDPKSSHQLPMPTPSSLTSQAKSCTHCIAQATPLLQTGRKPWIKGLTVYACAVNGPARLSFTSTLSCHAKESQCHNSPQQSALSLRLSRGRGSGNSIRRANTQTPHEAQRSVTETSKRLRSEAPLASPAASNSVPQRRVLSSVPANGLEKPVVRTNRGRSFALLEPQQAQGTEATPSKEQSCSHIPVPFWAMSCAPAFVGGIVICRLRSMLQGASLHQAPASLLLTHTHAIKPFHQPTLTCPTPLLHAPHPAKRLEAPPKTHDDYQKEKVQH